MWSRTKLSKITKDASTVLALRLVPEHIVLQEVMMTPFSGSDGLIPS